MNRRGEQRRVADKKRARAFPWRNWYRTKRWRLKRRDHLTRVPWCEPCKRAKRSRPAKVCDHKVPHRGDPLKFWHGELESQCETCHNLAKQREEHEGFTREIDADGWPTDARHPFNRHPATRGHSK